MRCLVAAILAVAVAAAVPAEGRADDAAPAPRHGLAMHGDLKYGPGFTHFDYVNPDAPKGGLVRLASTGGFDSLNGYIVKGEKAPGLGLIHDTLLTSSADEPFSEYGLLAESVTMPDDRSWVAFTLRPEARWHDGTPVTVDDVIWSFEVQREKGTPFFRFYYGNVDTVAKTGERTVTFSFKPGDNRELPLILGQVTILPRHWWEGRDFTRTTLEPPLGSGPYRITSVDPGRAIVYQRVEDYWGRDLPVNRGLYNFDEVRYDLYRDATVQLEAFKAGEFDFRAENGSKNWATGYDTPAVRRGLIQRREIRHQRPSGMQAFAYNLRRPLFTDRRVREALAYAFDFEWSNANLFYGQYRRTRSYFDNSEMAATGLPGEAELKLLEPFRDRVPSEVFTTEYTPPTADGSGQIRANLRRAAKLLEEAGWVVRGRQRVGPDGQPLTFEILLLDPQFERITLPYAKNLERLGVEARVRTVDTAQYQRRLDTFDYDMIVGLWGQSLSPGNEQRDFWSSAAADQEGSRNYLGLKDPAVDALVETLIAAPSRADLVTACQALDRVLQWGMYVIPHFHLDYDRLAFWDTFGMPDTVPMQGAQFFAWWIDPAKAAALKAAGH